MGAPELRRIERPEIGLQRRNLKETDGIKLS